MQFKLNNTVYKTQPDQISELWVRKFLAASPLDLCVDEISGYRATQVYTKYWEELKLLCIKLNVPINIEETCNQITLNRLHVYFPEQNKNATYNWNEWHRFNLLIHWLEHAISNRDPITYYDFNHCKNDKVVSRNTLPIVPRYTDLKANYIYLGYTQIGRSFMELFDSMDNISPTSHFIPQSLYNASCFIPHSNVIFDISLGYNYYKSRGKDFWPYEYKDPKMRLGYICVARPI